MFSRILDLQNLIDKKSLFLFGPRSTGKTTLLRQRFSDKSIINLLRSSVFISLSAQPGLIRDMAHLISKNDPAVVIDEIQKLPELLDEVHDLIETEGIRFILTGSSARKLRNSGVNLLAGRAWQCDLFPLVSAEIPQFDLERYLRFGGLPQVYSSDDPEEELDAYVNLYLKEEIKEESLVQKITHFSRFLRIAASANTEQINYANIASDSGIPASSVRAWFDILSDTFIGFTLEPWRLSAKRKAVATAKFYFFDIGVANFLRGTTNIDRNSAEFGKSFEHFIAMELRAWLSYRRIHKDLCYWRTQSGQEVDFLIGNDVAIEVKTALKVNDKHLSGLRALREEGIVKKMLLVSFDELDRQTEDGCLLLHWRSFLSYMWDKNLELL